MEISKKICATRTLASCVSIEFAYAPTQKAPWSVVETRNNQAGVDSSKRLGVLQNVVI